MNALFIVNKELSAQCSGCGASFFGACSPPPSSYQPSSLLLSVQTIKASRCSSLIFACYIQFLYAQHFRHIICDGGDDSAAGLAHAFAVLAPPSSTQDPTRATSLNRLTIHLSDAVVLLGPQLLAAAGEGAASFTIQSLAFRAVAESVTDLTLVDFPSSLAANLLLQYFPNLDVLRLPNPDTSATHEATLAEAVACYKLTAFELVWSSGSEEANAEMLTLDPRWISDVWRSTETLRSLKLEVDTLTAQIWELIARFASTLERLDLDFFLTPSPRRNRSHHHRIQPRLLPRQLPSPPRPRRVHLDTSSPTLEPAILAHSTSRQCPCPQNLLQPQRLHSLVGRQIFSAPRKNQLRKRLKQSSKSGTVGLVRIARRCPLV